MKKINKNNVMPLLNYSIHTELIAEEALKDKIIPFPNFEAVQFNEKIWVFSKGKSTTSYQLYLHSLRVVGELLNKHRKSNNLDYILKAKQIADSWIRFSKNNETKMTWYDHPTANRTQVLVDLIFELQSTNYKGDLEIYFKQLEIHCDYLMNDKNYRPNNHGLMMDRALIISGLVLNNELYFLKGKSRAQQTFWLSYSHNGVHLENSPEYHNMVTRIYTEIENYLNKNDSTLGNEINQMLETARGILSEIKKPNNLVPAIGDSSELSLNNGELSWKNFSDEESGLTIFKNKPNKLYLAFICGFSTGTHKHEDDLSIILNYKNKDYFSDSGKYNYISNRNRWHIVSNKAHSSFQLEEKYERLHENKFTKEIWTDTYFDNDIYSVVSGYHNKYKNASLRRTVYYLKKENIVIIRDFGKSTEEKEWLHRFNLSEQVKVEKINYDSALLKNGTDFIHFTWNTGLKYQYMEEFSKAHVKKPFISRRGNVKKNTTQILFTSNPKKEIESLFTIHFNENKKTDVKTVGNTIVVSVDGHTLMLPVV